MHTKQDKVFVMNYYPELFFKSYKSLFSLGPLKGGSFMSVFTVPEWIYHKIR